MYVSEDSTARQEVVIVDEHERTKLDEKRLNARHGIRVLVGAAATR